MNEWTATAEMLQRNLGGLTVAQRLNDDYRYVAGHLVQGRLHANLEGVLRVNTVIREAAVDCLRLIAELPGNRSAPSPD